MKMTELLPMKVCPSTIGLCYFAKGVGHAVPLCVCNLCRGMEVEGGGGKGVLPKRRNSLSTEYCKTRIFIL